MTLANRLIIMPAALMLAILMMAAPTAATASDEYRFRLGYNWPHIFIGMHHTRSVRTQECLTNRQIHRQFRRAGFENVRFLGEDRNGIPHYQFQNARDEVYASGVNRCTGRFILLHLRPYWLAR